MNAKEYRLNACAEGTTSKEAAAQKKADGRDNANKVRSRWLTALLFTMQTIQEKALSRTDGRIVPGMFEQVAGDTAKSLGFLGGAATRIAGFYGELAGDAVQATMDLWGEGLLDESTMGAASETSVQVTQLNRAKVLRSNKNWIGKARKLGLFSIEQEKRACDYENVLRALLFDVNPEVPVSEFRGRLIAAAQRFDYADDTAIGNHRADQYSLYVSVLDKVNRKHKALGETAERANKDILARINGGETVFAVVEGEIVQLA